MTTPRRPFPSFAAPASSSGSRRHSPSLPSIAPRSRFPASSCSMPSTTWSSRTGWRIRGTHDTPNLRRDGGASRHVPAHADGGRCVAGCAISGPRAEHESPEGDLSNELARMVMRFASDGAALVTAGSEGIARACRDELGIPAIAVNNVFSLPSMLPSEVRSNARGEFAAYWFSQTIGPGRGHEDVVRALGLTARPATLPLRGCPQARDASWHAARTRWHWEHGLERGALLAAVARIVS